MQSIKRILIVDDDRDLCDIIHDIMSSEGYKVDKAYDGEKALTDMTRNVYDLLIIDNKLGKISGINVLEQMKQLQPNLLAIMISAYGNEDTRLRARALGVQDFIDKPFDISSLVDRVNELICNVQ